MRNKKKIILKKKGIKKKEGMMDVWKKGRDSSCDEVCFLFAPVNSHQLNFSCNCIFFQSSSEKKC